LRLGQKLSTRLQPFHRYDRAVHGLDADALRRICPGKHVAAGPEELEQPVPLARGSHTRDEWRTGCHHRPMEYFTFAAKPTGLDPAGIEAALCRAWNACAGVACSKCDVPPWQYCRNRTSGTWYVTRFHRPRQDAADASGILALVGIYGLSWAKGAGRFTWDSRRVPEV
jgi:hypothetical protein